jgi:hypothetical protein
MKNRGGGEARGVADQKKNRNSNVNQMSSYTDMMANTLRMVNKVIDVIDTKKALQTA